MVKDLIYSFDALKTTIEKMAPLFDVVRVVDPFDTSILIINDNNTITRNRYSCFKVWTKHTRCRNCISMCSKISKEKKSKFEFIGEDALCYFYSYNSDFRK